MLRLDSMAIRRHHIWPVCRVFPFFHARQASTCNMPSHCCVPLSHVILCPGVYIVSPFMLCFLPPCSWVCMSRQQSIDVRGLDLISVQYVALSLSVNGNYWWDGWSRMESKPRYLSARIRRTFTSWKRKWVIVIIIRRCQCDSQEWGTFSN